MNVALMLNQKNDNAPAVAAGIITVLSDNSCKVFTDEKNAGFGFDGVSMIPDDKLLDIADMCICIGGDGTTIRCGKRAARKGIPLLSVNTGRVGFLTSIESNEPDKLADIINGQFCEDKRMLLDVGLYAADGSKVYGDLALNEAFLTRTATSHIIDFKLELNGREVSAFRGDGMVLATPTGSTAYSMSAGGPIVDPELNAIISTPICPYLLSLRPVIYPASAVLTMSVSQLHGREAYLTVDGGEPHEVSDGMTVRVERSQTSLVLLKPENSFFFDRIKEKLF